MRYPRRTRFEIQLGRLLKIDQQWRRRDDRTVWTVAQIHRLDCVVDLRRDGTRILISFDALRRDWKWIAHTPRPKETA